MFSLVIRNMIFAILQPGVIAGVIPYLIIRNKIVEFPPQTFLTQHYTGCIVFILGFFIMTTCIISFAVKGRGTLSPADPTKKLVTSGLYRYSRNPMYVGVMLILIGEAIFFLICGLLIYLMFIFIAFNLFIILVEEKRLKRDFGNQYKAYCDSVRRWL